MKRILILAGFLSLFTQALTAIAQSDDQSWRDKVIVYYFNETLDGKMGSGPVLPVRYGQSNVFVATRHIAEMFAGERKGSVKAGYADGRMIPPTAWIPDPITGSCRDTHYSVDRYSVNDQGLFIGYVVRDFAHGIAEPAPSQFPKDRIVIRSLTQGKWVEATVLDYDLNGTLWVDYPAKSGDSGSLVFDRQGRGVGIVTGAFTEIDGRKLDGGIVITRDNPRINFTPDKLGTGLSPADPLPKEITIPNGSPIIADPNWKHEIVPRTPETLLPVGNFLYVLAKEDASIWRQNPPDQSWTLVSNLPPIIKLVK